MSVRPIIAALAFSWSLPALALNLEASLSEEAAKFGFNSFIGGHQYGRTLASGGLFFNNDDDRVLDFGVHAIDLAGTKTPGLQAGVGGRFYFGEISDADALAFALGGLVSYRPPAAQRWTFGADAHYAPNIVSFLDAERLYEFTFRVGYSLLPQADVFIGYRKIGVEADGDSVSADDGGHVGLRINF